MTVISMLSFGDSGAAIADEQVSSICRGRKSNIVNKLKIIGSFIFGGSGGLHLIGNIYARLESSLPTECNLDKIAQYLPGVTIQLINEFKSSYFQANYGLSLAEILAGEKGKLSDSEIRKKCLEELNSWNRDFSENSLLVGGIPDKKFEMHYFSLGNCSFVQVALPYISIGSGSDEAERILSEYIERKPKKERDKVDKIEGILKLVEATNQASRVNMGVGGIPQIVYCDKEAAREIEEEKCVLVSEIVKGYSFEQLGRDFVNEAIEGLIFGEAKFPEVEEQMKKKAKDWDRLDKLLRGYKI